MFFRVEINPQEEQWNIMKGNMKSSFYECKCGISFSANTEENKAVRCPACGNLSVHPITDKGSSKRGDFDDLADATFEIMAEGGVFFSGAR